MTDAFDALVYGLLGVLAGVLSVAGYVMWRDGREQR